MIINSDGLECQRTQSEGRRCHYLAVKKLSASFRGITTKSNRDFYFLNCLHPFGTKNKLDSNKKVCENETFCNVIMLSDSTKLLELKQSQKSDKAPFINYADLECIIEKIDACKNNPEKLSATKVSENTPSIFLNVYNVVIRKHRK